MRFHIEADQFGNAWKHDHRAFVARKPPVKLKVVQTAHDLKPPRPNAVSLGSDRAPRGGALVGAQPGLIARLTSDTLDGQ